MKPCKSCPFARATPPGALGGSKPTVFIGQAHGPFWLPCHSAPGYVQDPNTALQHRHCAGAAIYRANCGLTRSLPSQLPQAPTNTKEVFGSPAEFFAHHTHTRVETAAKLLTAVSIAHLTAEQMARPNNKITPISQP